MVAREQAQGMRWSVARAQAYGARLATLRGCNYIPRTCVNTTQMWQELDERVVDQELGWAAQIGLNSLRVFLQYIVYEAAPEGFLARFERFLDIAARHGHSVMPVLLDDCWGPEPALGAQSQPVPGVHNSGWTSSPGVTRRKPEHWPQLREYVQGVIHRLADDGRIVAWDLYNEPAAASRPLVEATFSWARDVRPTQPLVTCWQADDLADITTFHAYSDVQGSEFAQSLQQARSSGRPAVCTECLARTMGNTLPRLLPRFAAAGIGWYVWGLVAGATQTRFPWGWPAGGPEPAVWFHDLLHPDGRIYSADEADLVRAYAAVAADECRGPH
jgi:hypothetical protein